MAILLNREEGILDSGYLGLWPMFEVNRSNNKADVPCRFPSGLGSHWEEVQAQAEPPSL